MSSLGVAILNGNKEKDNVYINLKGMELGDPYVSPSFHFKSYPTYAYEHDIITKDVADDMLDSWPSCDQGLKDYCDFTDEDIDTDLCIEYFEDACGLT